MPLVTRKLQPPTLTTCFRPTRSTRSIKPTRHTAYLSFCSGYSPSTPIFTQMYIGDRSIGKIMNILKFKIQAFYKSRFWIFLASRAQLNIMLQCELILLCITPDVIKIILLCCYEGRKMKRESSKIPLHYNKAIKIPPRTWKGTHIKLL